MGCAAPSHVEVLRRLSKGQSAAILLAMLARPCVVSTVERVTTVLISAPTLRAVSYFSLAVLHCDTDNGTSGGGCTVASPLGNNVADGKNCKTIPNVVEVECDIGTCKVISCKKDYLVSSSQDSCVKARLDRVRRD